MVFNNTEWNIQICDVKPNRHVFLPLQIEIQSQWPATGCRWPNTIAQGSGPGLHPVSGQLKSMQMFVKPHAVKACKLEVLECKTGTLVCGDRDTLRWRKFCRKPSLMQCI